MFYLTDVNGPRLTGSPAYKAAADWVVKRMTEYGLTAKEEKWGPFGRGWATKHFEAHLIEPQYQPLIGVPLAWTAGTDGTVTGEPIMVKISVEADFEKYKGKLKGKVVMATPAKQLAMQTTRVRTSSHRRGAGGGRRWRPNLAGRPSDSALPAVQTGSRRPRLPKKRGSAAKNGASFRKSWPSSGRTKARWCCCPIGYNGDGGTVFASSGGPYDVKKPIARDVRWR